MNESLVDGPSHVRASQSSTSTRTHKHPVRKRSSATMNTIHPLQIDPATGEPFLRLPAPLENIIITPPRLTDVPALLRLLNDPRVHETLSGPPWPYLEEHATEWLSRLRAKSDQEWTELQEAASKNSEAPRVFGFCPVRSIREVQEDGSQLYLGDCCFDRWGADLITDEVEEIGRENEEKPVGDESIIWTFGDYLAPSHHGKGIMTAVIGTILKEWAIPRMNARHARTTTFEHNIGSLKTFQKNGFVLVETVQNRIPISEAKGGGKVGMNILHWDLEVKET
ncbi:hypothetical protein SISSUDRAFT_37929 [Sistotremastrum suecicum HHB10207 ss-3]|uniref:N-acetyltransferase domain-containing protein n=1 Tax=Sistotremastrum suecicum HHB10207 ss-3 TaxID=1314776 RepID=A0A166JDX9_9AGAM|nr:hypothetical protein SISSUDRAFT_37929 [Sistotremastrum suecicum HHB10207 ss-3]